MAIGKGWDHHGLLQFGLRLVSAYYAAMLLKISLDLQMEQYFLYLNSSKNPCKTNLLNYNICQDSRDISMYHLNFVKDS